MAKQLIFRFEELPLLIDGGFSAGLVNGQALISYWDDGSWGVQEIYLDGSRRKPTSEIVRAVMDKTPDFRCWDEKPVCLDRGTHLFSMIHDRLENDWAPYVLDAIHDAVEKERAA